MNKYLLRFSKKNYMRFIGHLDVYNLLRRAIRKSDIDVDYSIGFNPHEKINIVQPLSLGFESDSEYLEITTRTYYEASALPDLLNCSMPDDLFFYDCKIIDEADGNYTNLCSFASYNVSLRLDENCLSDNDIASFLARNEIVVKKRDKKTKQFVDKNVKELINTVKITGFENGRLNLLFVVKCATNENLNPLNLAIAIIDYFKLNTEKDLIRITRKDIFNYSDGRMLPLYECKILEH